MTGKNTFEPLNATATLQNRLTGYGYDAAGNMISNGSAAYVYDAENRLIATAGMSYIYDGDGKRVEKCTQGTTAGTCSSTATGTLYWRGWGDEVNTETDLAGNSIANYIFFNGQRIARRDVSTGAMHYYFSDHLGTHSLVTDVNGTMPPQEESDFYPYGGEIPVSCSDTNHYKFTGKERDSESGLDNFGARYDSSSLGRFMTPDWEAKPITVPYATFGDPQTLNLYAYVENAPVNRVDADGHCDLQGASDCPHVSVTPDAGPHVMRNIPLGKGLSITAIGTTTTITLTKDGKPASGVQVKESPTTKNDLTGKTKQSLSRQTTVATSEKGKIGDIVGQPVTDKPVSAKDARVVGEVGAEVPISNTTTQTLTFNVRDAQGATCTCQATYSETLSNINSNGQLNPMNSTGTNFNPLTVTEPNVQERAPQSQEKSPQ